MDVSENSGTPKSSIFIGVSKNYPFWAINPYFWKHPYDEGAVLAFVGKFSSETSEEMSKTCCF